MKLPIAFTLGNREVSLDKDPLMRNALAEPTEQEGVVKARKRPAIDSAFTTTAGVGQGIFTWNQPGFTNTPEETLISINDDSLNTAPTPITKLLRFTVQPPASNDLNTALSPAVKVSALTKYGSVVTSFTSNISLSLGTNPTGATLGGTATVAAVSGVATFSTITLNRSGSGFTLAAASSGLRGATSDAFKIPTELVFTQQPSFAAVDTVLSEVEITVRDSDSNTDSNYDGEVTVSLYSNSSGGTLSGTLTVDAVSGVATFDDLEIDTAGTYSLRASAAEVDTAFTPAPVISDSFGIGAISVTAAQSGIDTGVFGFSADGQVLGPLGSVSPDTFYGQDILFFFTDTTGEGTPLTTFRVGPGLSQGVFTSVTVGAITLFSANASFTSNGSFTQWQWSSAFFSAATAYQAEFA